METQLFVGRYEQGDKPFVYFRIEENGGGALGPGFDREKFFESIQRMAAAEPKYRMINWPEKGNPLRAPHLNYGCETEENKIRALDTKTKKALEEKIGRRIE